MNANILEVCERAAINFWMHWHHTGSRKSTVFFRTIFLGNDAAAQEKELFKVIPNFWFMERELGRRGTPFLAGPTITIADLALIPVALLSLGGLPLDFPWQAPALTAATQILNAVGALFLVMALSRGKATIVAPTTNALAPALTIVVSLIAYQALPTPYGAVGIVLALVGSTLMVYSDEKRGEAPTVAVQPTVAPTETMTEKRSRG